MATAFFEIETHEAYLKRCTKVKKVLKQRGRK